MGVYLGGASEKADGGESSGGEQWMCEVAHSGVDSNVAVILSWVGRVTWEVVGCGWYM